MQKFKLVEEDKKIKTKTYTIVVDGTHDAIVDSGNFNVQPVWGSVIDNTSSFMNIYFTVDSLGNVLDIEVQVN